ncbi:MAG: TetR/AcrR family transcriptional regulator [Firmicutes bacterium]|nr:TetR/AcrR family transcriptional regulator [Bacillota bacterium]
MANLPKGDKREKILQAAAEVFGIAGFHEARIEEIAERAGIGKGTIYLYFKDKQELYLAMLQYQLASMVERLRLRLEASGTAVERLTGFLVEFFVLVRHYRGLPASQVRPPHACEERCRGLLLAARQTIHQMLTQVFRTAEEETIPEDLEPGFAATVLLGMAQGLAMDYLLGGNDFDPLSAAQKLVHLLCRKRDAGG